VKKFIDTHITVQTDNNLKDKETVTCIVIKFFGNIDENIVQDTMIC